MVKEMGAYNPVESIVCLVEHMEKGQELARSGGQTIADVTMVYKGITLLPKIAILNDDIQ